MELLHFFGSGLMFMAGLWILGASIWRIAVMRWGDNDPLQLVAYILIAAGAATHSLIPIPEMRPLLAVGVAVLFYAGRRRWLTGAPQDVCRVPTRAEFEVGAALRASAAMPDPHRDATEAQLQALQRGQGDRR